MRTSATTLDLSTTGAKGPVDVGNTDKFSVHLVGVTGGGSVTIETSVDGCVTWQALGAARTADVVVTVTDLYCGVRVNVGTAKAGAKAYVRVLRSHVDAA